MGEQVLSGGWYSRWVFPWILEAAMRQPRLEPLRREALAPAAGSVLEIGIGTGLNCNHYPASCRSIAAVDTNPALTGRARHRAAAAGMTVAHQALSAEALPFEDASFDTVVSTFTMCSIPDLGRALGELRRVLKPGGQVLFLEHGLSPDAAVARWQRRLTPAWRVIGDGCHLDRDTPAELADAGLAIDTLRQCYLPGAPRFAGFLSLGVARRATS
jgi:ubiquinone/menaquinone biosynthesis C-methylase UbiE